jgi:FkbM family methyltransferase
MFLSVNKIRDLSLFVSKNVSSEHSVLLFHKFDNSHDVVEEREMCPVRAVRAVGVTEQQTRLSLPVPSPCCVPSLSVEMIVWLPFVIAVASVALSSAVRQRIKPNELALRNAEHTINIHFPRTIMGKDWRKQATYSDLLAAESTQEYAKFSKAQDEEDIMLYENWFYGMKDGLLLESGACQGDSLSLGYLFENFAKWSAINVEPDPSVFRILKSNRRNAINVFTALCSNDNKVFHYTDAMGYGSPVRGFIEFMDQKFLKKYHPDIFNNKTALEDLAKMRCVTVKNLLKSLAVPRLDIWILDVEGAEEEVLLGTDFSAIHIDAIVMENDGFDPDKDRRKVAILETNDFSCTQIDRNVFCKHKTFHPSTKPQIATSPTSSKQIAYWDGVQWVMRKK